MIFHFKVFNCYLINILFFFLHRFLIDRGADLSLVNNDGDLAIDIADSDEMESLLQREIDTRGKFPLLLIVMISF